jgi:hypothetical protein
LAFLWQVLFESSKGDEGKREQVKVRKTRLKRREEKGKIKGKLL